MPMPSCRIDRDALPSLAVENPGNSAIRPVSLLLLCRDTFAAPFPYTGTGCPKMGHRETVSAVALGSLGIADIWPNLITAKLAFYLHVEQIIQQRKDDHLNLLV